IGANVANTKIGKEAGDVDLFGWSTSTDGGASTTDNYGIKTSFNGNDYPGDFYDWGKAVGDGSTWRTLSKDEWTYLFDTRTMTNSKARYSNAINGVTIGGTTYKGLFLYPDDYNGEVVSSSMTWDEINAAGIVFLPATGSRSGTNVSDVGDKGNYWSSTVSDSGSGFAYSALFDSSEVIPLSNGRDCGCSVRLVTE
ncbi:MAG: hypothetical protein MJY70_04705, partial [Bacteroidales bacterium]|nr:hypothetical protein [Bacteroidales bacterium]